MSCYYYYYYYFVLHDTKGIVVDCLYFCTLGVSSGKNTVDHPPVEVEQAGLHSVVLGTEWLDYFRHIPTFLVGHTIGCCWLVHGWKYITCSSHWPIGCETHKVADVFEDHAFLIFGALAFPFGRDLETCRDAWNNSLENAVIKVWISMLMSM